MDRLVCGDVGFGKTEVALRAAWVALADGKQVALLVPTTLLAEQHFQTFSDRFSDTPVRMAELSRFRSAKEVKTALAALAVGSSTLSSARTSCCSPTSSSATWDSSSTRAPLRRAPEGTAKWLRAEVDVLTLTATPIPRTLRCRWRHPRFFGMLRAAAPPAIKTFVAPIRRGSFARRVARVAAAARSILHNDIDTIATKARSDAIVA
jgi:transcription-repair coupling factor (superfamily II helicase)